MEVLRIAIADDHALFRQGIRSLLQLRDDVIIVAEIAKADDIAPTLSRLACDVLLLDLQMERSLLSDIEALSTKVPVIIVTGNEQSADAIEAIRAGARAVVYKRFAIETLKEAIDVVRRGQVWFPETLQAILAAQLREPRGEALTRREREIVQHVALGLRNAEVGKKLFISEDTVKTHLNNVFRKLGLRDRSEVTRYAIRMGLVGVHDSSN